MTTSNVDLRVQGDPGGDCPPDVYQFEFGSDPSVNLCIRCAAARASRGNFWTEGMGPLVKGGVCEDCGNTE